MLVFAIAIVVSLLAFCGMLLHRGLALRARSPRAGWALVAVALAFVGTTALFAWHLYAQRAAWQSDSLVIGLLNLLGMMMIDWPLVSPPALAVTIMIFADDAKRIARHTSRPT